MTKRVICLYRVSTKMQVHKEKDDIPMQKAECRRFIAGRPDWELYEEIAEKGVSGYKNSSQDRDALNEIMKKAVKKEFDILLVYMSDRLGRREDDTPFFVAGLNNAGIEVWSVNEGPLKTGEHIDKLLNYIRFWNAEGESLKTAVRVRDAQLDMIRRGLYTGGGCPYGYRHVYSGQYNNRGRALKKLEIDDAQAETVRQIFRLSAYEGMGGYRIAQELNRNNIPTQKGSRWTLCTINNILRNPIYKGYYSYGKGKVNGRRGRISPEQWVCSPTPDPELAIIGETLWNEAQEARESRTPQHLKPKHSPKGASCENTVSAGSRLLLLGLAYCGYCGSRLSNGTAYDKWTTKDGRTHQKIRRRYKCTGKSEGAACPGCFTYRQEDLEDAVLAVMEKWIGRFREESVLPLLLKEQQARRKQIQKKLQAVRQRIRSTENDIHTLKEQLPLAVRNEFVLSLAELEDLLTYNKKKLEQARMELADGQKELDACTLPPETPPEKYIVPKVNIFRELSLPEKKQFISAMINRIEVKEDSLLIEMKPGLEEFLPPVSHSDGSTSH